uniref:Lymphocyte antigen 96 n=1 Tax=Pelusios castaneus TaxID=367368 RepID=A0A8C8RTS5_9SAUR
MFQLVFFTLFTSGLTESQGKEIICNNSDIELSYSFCDSVAHRFSFRLLPCSINEQPWFATIFWIPRSDIVFLRYLLSSWYNGAKLLDIKKDVCSGFDDDYSFCGSLKGETINTTVRFSGLKITLKEGIYTIVLRGFSDHSEENLLMCVNSTLTIKRET